MSETFSMEAIEGDVGLAIESTEGTAPISPTLSLFMLKGNTPNLEEVEDQKFERHAYNEKHPRGRDLIRFHSEGDGTGLLFAPDNGLPEMVKAAFGVDWNSTAVYTVPVVETLAGVKRNDILTGKTSLARAVVLDVDTSTTPDSILVGDVQGVFTSGETLTLHTAATTSGGTDLSLTVATGGSTLVTGYYAHKMDAVKYQQNLGVVLVNTVATFACVCDPLVDFRNLQTTSGRRKVKVVLKDTATPAAISLEGWLGEAIMAIPFTSHATATPITVGQTLSSKTTTGAIRVIGTVIAVDATATGTVWVECTSATASFVVNGETLSGTTTTTMTAIATLVGPAYKYNACRVYRYNESGDTTRTWNGDIATFDETDVITYKAVQKIFDQTSMAYYVKHAGDLAMVGNGMHIKDITLNASNKDYTYKTTLLGRTLSYPTTKPAFPGALTAHSPYGAGSRTLELDGSLIDANASYVLDANFGITFDIAIDKGMTVDKHYPTYLQPNSWGATGSLQVQYRSNDLMRASWGGSGVSTPTSGSKITKRLFMLLETGEDVVTGYPYRMDIGCMGTIQKAALSRDADGYVLPITLEAVNLPDTVDGEYNWAPLQIFIWDNSATH